MHVTPVVEKPIEKPTIVVTPEIEPLPPVGVTQEPDIVMYENTDIEINNEDTEDSSDYILPQSLQRNLEIIIGNSPLRRRPIWNSVPRLHQKCITRTYRENSRKILCFLYFGNFIVVRL